MSTPINDGGPAYPCQTNPLPGKLANAPQGMTLRDYFAGQALNGYLASWEGTNAPDFFTPDHVAPLAYAYADAMLEARKGGQGV